MSVKSNSVRLGLPTPQERSAQYKANFAAYGERLKRDKQPLPESNYLPGTIYLSAVSREAGVPYTFLRSVKEPLKALRAKVGIARRIEDHRKRSNLTSAHALSAEYKARVATWAAERRSSPSRLPANPRDATKPNVKRIAGMMNVPAGFLRCGGAKILAALVEEFKLEVAPAPVEPWISLAAVAGAAPEWRRRSLEAEGRSAETVEKEARDINWAINHAIKAAGSAAAEAYPAVYAAFQATLGTDKRKLRQQLRLVLNFLAEHVKNDGLPKDLFDAMKAARLKIGMSHEALANALGMSVKSLGKWRTELPPGGRQSQIEQAEAILGLPRGTLTGRALYRTLDRRPIPGPAYPAEARKSPRARAEIRRQITDEERALPLPALAARCREIWEDLQAAKPAFHLEIAELSKQPFALAELPRHVEEEFGRMVTAKRSEAPLDGELDPGAGRWSPATVDIQRRALKVIFGILAQSGVAVETATLGHLVFPKLGEIVLRYLYERKGRRLSTTDFGLLYVWRSWLRSPTGLLFQQDWIKDHIAPVAGLIEASDVTRVRGDWPGACATAAEAYLTMRRRWKATVKRAHQRHDLVDPLLRSPNPLEGVAMMIRGLRRDIAGLASEGQDRARLVRKLLYVGIQAQCAFRSATLVGLEIKHLVRRDGCWWLIVPASLFKNGRSKAFEMARGPSGHFERKLEDIEGLYDTIATYLEGRRALASGSRRLFVTGAGKSVKKNFFSQLCRDISADYVAWNEGRRTGIPGVQAFPNHAFRDLLATSVLKHTGSERLAAMAIVDSVQTVITFYSHWKLNDWQRALAGAIVAGLSGPNDPAASARASIPLPMAFA